MSSTGGGERRNPPATNAVREAADYASAFARGVTANVDANPPYGLLIMPSKVFISYRREDSRYQARRVYDAFVHALPPDTVFMDVDSIPPGADFVEILEGWVQQCDVLLALIGPNWLKSVDPRTKRRRVDSPEDFVRIEVRGALARKIPVVPVLLDAAEMPTAAELPDDIKALRRRHAEFVDFRTFDADVQRLIKRLKLGKQVELPSEAPAPQAEDGGSTDAATVKSALERVKLDAVAVRPLILTAVAVSALAIGAVAYVMNSQTRIDASTETADFAKSEESRRTAEARASQATDALAIAVKARQEAEATVSTATAAQAKSEESRRAAETRAGEASDTLAKTEKARQEAEAKAADAAAAQAKSEEGRRAAETRAGEAADALAKTEKARQEAEVKAAAATATLVKTEEDRRAAEARANEAADTMKKSDRARLDAEARATSAAAAQAKAEEGQRTAEKARAAAEGAASGAAIARAQAETARQSAETRASAAAEALARTEKARQEAEAKLAAQAKANDLRARADAPAFPAPLPAGVRPTAGSQPSVSRKLLADIGGKSGWAIGGATNCNLANDTRTVSLDVASDSMMRTNGLGNLDVEKILAGYENMFYTVTLSSNHISGTEPGQRWTYTRDGDRIQAQPWGRSAFVLTRCP
jgi:TIR domain